MSMFSDRLPEAPHCFKIPSNAANKSNPFKMYTGEKLGLTGMVLSSSHHHIADQGWPCFFISLNPILRAWVFATQAGSRAGIGWFAGQAQNTQKVGRTQPQMPELWISEGKEPTPGLMAQQSLEGADGEAGMWGSSEGSPLARYQAEDRCLLPVK